MTIMGMGVGTGAVVMLVGLGFGLQGILLEQIILGETLLSLNVSNPSSKAVVLNDKTIVELARIEQVKDVSPLATVAALVTFNGLTGNITLFGAKPPYFRYAGSKVSEGTLFKDGEEVSDANKVLLTRGALKLFNVESKDVLGQEVSFRVFVPKNDGSGDVQEMSLNKKYIVKGVTDEPSAIGAYISLAEVTSQFPVQMYERAQVRVEASSYLNDITNKIIDKGFRVTALSKTVDQANKIFNGVQAVLATFGGIALVVSAIGMFNTMTVTLLERTAEIGIMRTIGASPKNIMVLFLMESVIVGFLGGVIGILFGVIVGFSVNLLINSVAARYGGIAIKLFAFPIFFLLFISSFSAIVGFLTGIFPARRAASLNPLDAIRYK